MTYEWKTFEIHIMNKMTFLNEYENTYLTTNKLQQRENPGHCPGLNTSLVLFVGPCIYYIILFWALAFVCLYVTWPTDIYNLIRDVYKTSNTHINSNEKVM